ncbi:hypothetical protein Van01_27350 [Micromonospora andamanensis]|uniref:Response regulatory domain-containing protein n=1 Tax=Micromonospora andamanensis TaxID=1287068 RepID=A0ABQ4HV57_9ACTN|nr:hypothetical protein Van01_27350 [Micromonospora andamanensis]
MSRPDPSRRESRPIIAAMCAQVLVADDDPRQAEVVRRYLIAEGHAAVVVHDGRAALDTARRLRPDCWCWT